MSKQKKEPIIVNHGLATTPPKQIDKPVVRTVNEEIDSEYGWVGNSIPDLLKAILRELVRARLERGNNG